MLRLSLALLSILLLVARAQAGPIAGIGEFRLGMTLSELMALPSIRNKTIATATPVAPQTIRILNQESTKTFEESQRIHSPDLTRVIFQYDFGLQKHKDRLPRVIIDIHNERVMDVHISDLPGEVLALLIHKYGEPDKIEGDCNPDDGKIHYRYWYGPSTTATLFVFDQCTNEANTTLIVKNKNFIFSEINKKAKFEAIKF